MRSYLDGQKEDMHNKESAVLDEELSKLEEKHETLTQAKQRLMADEALTQDQRAERYNKVKTSSIFDDADVADGIDHLSRGHCLSIGTPRRPLPDARQKIA